MADLDLVASKAKAERIKAAEAKVVEAAIRQCGEILEPGKAQWLLRCAVDALMDARMGARKAER